MKQTLQVKLSQQLAMTPQLQQAIRLLQLSFVDLQHEIQQALESNPLLEVEDADFESPVSDQNSTAIDNEVSLTVEQANLTKSEMVLDHDISSDSNESWSLEIPTELPVDTSWDDIYQSPVGPVTLNSGVEYETKDESMESLREHLLWQLNLTPMSDIDQYIAMSIIDDINADGYLQLSIDDIQGGLADLPIERDEIYAVLHRIQQFDPTGVGAQNLKECLLLQLAQLSQVDPHVAMAKQIVLNHLDLLANHDYIKLTRRTGLTEDKLQNAIELIQSLSPRPGAKITSSNTQYIIPDVTVRKQHDCWFVELNAEITPKLQVNSDYAAMIKKTDNGETNSFLRGHLQEAKWFIKSLISRHETLLKVASAIVKRQQAFFDYGPEAMKPLVLQDIATELDMHESTVSRVTSNKYMNTPRGVFELKYFFSSHVGTASGGECSATAIQALIKKLVAAEVPKKPLSDSKIAKLLGDKGINIARRTIAKYREALAIPPSNERKRLA